MKPLGKWDWIILFIVGTVVLNIIGLAIVAMFFSRSHYWKEYRKKKSLKRKNLLKT